MARVPRQDFLATLLSPGSKRRFLATHWPDRPLVTHGPVARLAALTELPQLASLAALAQAVHEPVSVWGKERSIDTDPRSALALYQEGMTLYFVRADRWVPGLRALVGEIERALGLRPGDGYVSVFASRAGSGAPLHFDPDFNLNVQLRGTKTWWIAENRSIKHPPLGHSLRATVPRELTPLLHDDLPTEVPSDARSFVASPGTVVFLPRGHWHATRAHEDSLAVDFALRPATWSAIVADELRRLLTAEESFREAALGVGGTARQRGEARARLSELLAQVPTLVERIDPRALIPGAAAPTRTRRRPTR